IRYQLPQAPDFKGGLELAERASATQVVVYSRLCLDATLSFVECCPACWPRRRSVRLPPLTNANLHPNSLPRPLPANDSAMRASRARTYCWNSAPPGVPTPRDTTS